MVSGGFREVLFGGSFLSLKQGGLRVSMPMQLTANFLWLLGTACLLVGQCWTGPVSADEEISFSTEQLMAHVKKLADESMLGRKAGTPFERRAADYVVQQLEAMEVNPLDGDKRLQHFRLLPSQAGPTSLNVLGSIAPTEVQESEGVLVLGAHIDHLGAGEDGRYFPGANDNASGVAVVLEVARALKRRSGELRRPIVVVFFGAEEVGLIGSRRFLGEGPVDNSQIVAMVNVDMIGRPLIDQSKLAILKRLLKVDSDNSVGVVGTVGRPFFVKTVEEAGRRAKLSVYGTQPILSPIATQLASNRADHSPFESLGIPTVFFGSGESDDYHQPTDTVDKLVPELMARRAVVVYETVRTLATATRDKIPARRDPNAASKETAESR
jgi:aminopeptidase YwaD